MIFTAVTDWDDAYANRDHIPDADGYPPRWERAAASFRDALGPRARLGLTYGPGARQALDLFLPEADPRGLAVFVHGGYWRRFDRPVWSHLAAGPLAQGWAVAMPSYRLAPEARIARIARDVAAAVERAADEVAGPIVLAGHSAGGHLVTRLMCSDGLLADGVAARVGHVLSISGVHDLRPLLRTAMNADLRLDPPEAASESPALLEPRPGTRLTAWVGGDERPEFIRQSALLANVWTGLGAATASVVESGRHHFDVIDSLTTPDGALARALTDIRGRTG
ncbi:alpha/beta hydrolase [Limibaculum sp. FT325]|uniref:alpha/beta hydrolase n=1 Tax=Thermohalobaculum sediminis TaxID=2939436 RepID=UPI0020BD54F0|nr:alpha/beta hydrolase [Limibaculum sediminis]MCL5778621.1 alpha/beta hydrolase [Limibaculum sediminis]